MKISHVRINHIKNPIGFHLDHLYVSWLINETKAKKLIETRVQVAQDQQMKQVVYTKLVTDFEATGVELDFSLKPYTRYYFQLECINDLNEKAISEVCFFETAKMNEPWLASFIAPMSDETSLLIKNFTLDKPIQKARLYICGLGLYEAYLNNCFVNQEYLMPGFTSYDDYIQYQTYDITLDLQVGENRIEIALGNGWYKGRMGFDGGYTSIYGAQRTCIMEMHITYEDGSQEVIVSDESFNCKPSPILDEGIYDGESYDVSLETTAIIKPVIILDLDKKKLSERYSVPIHINEKRKVKEVIHTRKNELILDFGQNITGWVEFTANQDLVLSYSEILQDGCFYNANYRESKPYFIYHAHQQLRTVRPHFTFYGFRYVKVECLQPINVDDFVACLITSDLERTGFLETGYTKVNQLISNAYYSQRDNFLDVPTDCPQRDERLGWTGDAQIFAGTASFNLNTAAFYRKYLRDMFAEQKQLGGSVPFTVPMLKPKLENFVEWPNKPKDTAAQPLMMLQGHGASPWSDAAAIIPWTLYQYYGDKTLLKETYPNMKMFIDYVIKEDQQHGNHYLYDFGFHFADWLALDNKKDPTSPFGATDIHYVASVFYYYSISLVQQAAVILGRKEDSDVYQKRAKLIKKAIRKKYLNESGLLKIDTQTGLILALKFDLLENDEIQINSDYLIKKLKTNNMHLDTGFVGTPYLNLTLSKINHNQEAYQLLFNEDYPGWLYEINLGATTIWERWNSILPDGSMNPQGMNSLNHYAYGSIVEWIYRYVAGLNQVTPGFKEVIIAPKPHYALGYCKMRYQSISGEYQIEWRYQDEKKIVYDLVIPFGCRATIILNEQQKYTVESGTYHYQWNL